MARGYGFLTTPNYHQRRALEEEAVHWLEQAALAHRKATVILLELERAGGPIDRRRFDAKCNTRWTALATEDALKLPRPAPRWRRFVRRVLSRWSPFNVPTA